MSVSRAEMAAQARERRQLVAGLLAALEHREPGALREADVVEAAEVSTTVFRAHFDDLDACFDFACEAALDTILSPVVASRFVSRPPAARLAATLAALLGSLAARPRYAELCLLHSPVRQADRHTRRRLEDAVAELLLDLRPLSAAAASQAGEAALARGLIGFIAADLADRPAEDLEGLHPRLLALLAPVFAPDDGVIK
ncbi:MAG TPA: hypothetical protein VMH33_10015 [Solirubrobacterales bacterium]|nr:hypothetical protein [Solirubrobacterales bacterium]